MNTHYTFWMFVFSLVVNSFSLPFLEEVLKNLVNVFNSKYVSKLVQNSYAWLEKEINFLNRFPAIEPIASSSDTKEEESSCEECLNSEEIDNPFEAYFRHVIDKVKVCNKGKSKNPLYKPEAIHVLVNTWLPTVPFWSSLLLGQYNMKTIIHVSSMGISANICR